MYYWELLLVINNTVSRQVPSYYKTTRNTQIDNLEIKFLKTDSYLLNKISKN